MAGRRLRQADPHRGAADIGFPQQRVERDQQIEVKRIQIHEVNIYHIRLSIGRMRGRGAMIGESQSMEMPHERRSQQETGATDLCRFSQPRRDDLCGSSRRRRELGRDRAIFLVADIQGTRGDPERPDGPFPLVLRRAAADGRVQFHRRGRLCRGRGQRRQRHQGRAALRQPVLHGVADRARQDQGDQGILQLDAGRARARTVSARKETAAG